MASYQRTQNIKNIFFEKNFINYPDYIKKLYGDGYDIGIAPVHNSLFNIQK